MWHRIDKSTVVETTDIDPEGRFHPSFVWVKDGGANAGIGFRYDESTKSFIAPNPPPAESHASMLARAKSELRTMRAPMLDALTGIAGRAERAGNDALAAEADALAELLLDITDDAALNAATTYEDMQAAGVAAYKRIAAAASPALSVVFKEITGA